MAGPKTANRRKKTRSLKGKTKSFGSRLSSLARGFKPGGAKIHGKPGGGGGNPYGTNNVGMTISAAKKLYANQLAEGISLKDAMRHNKAETISFYDLLDEKNDTKKNNMSVTISPSTGGGSGSGPQQQSDKDWLKGAYKKAFGEDRVANFDAKGGAQYWLDQMAANPNSHSRSNVMNMLTGSDEGVKYAASGVTMPGGVDPSKSLHSQFGGDNTWLNHWAPGGKLAPDNVDNTFTDVNSSISQINPGTTYQNFDDDTFIKPIITDPGQPGPGPAGPSGEAGWWTQFADADAFKKFLQPDQKSDGMGDFMKFMMLMNVMRPGGQGGYGGGGSQYGYGGLNPGGVQSAYDPMASLTGMGDWFKKNFGSGGSTTATVNTD